MEQRWAALANMPTLLDATLLGYLCAWRQTRLPASCALGQRNIRSATPCRWSPAGLEPQQDQLRVKPLLGGFLGQWPPLFGFADHSGIYATLWDLQVCPLRHPPMPSPD